MRLQTEIFTTRHSRRISKKQSSRRSPISKKNSPSSTVTKKTVPFVIKKKSMSTSHVSTACRDCGGGQAESMSSASVCRPNVYEVEHEMVVEQYPVLSDTLQTGVPMISAYVDGPPCDPLARYHVNMYPNGSVARYQVPYPTVTRHPDCQGHSSVFVHLTCRRTEGDTTAEETTRHVHMKFATVDAHGNESFSRTATHPLIYDWGIQDVSTVLLGFL